MNIKKKKKIIQFKLTEKLSVIKIIIIMDVLCNLCSLLYKIIYFILVLIT